MPQETSNQLKKMPQELIMANTVHEIRTPVQTIIGTLDLLSDTELNTEQLDYVRQIRFGAEVLLSLVNDILDFSKIKSKKMTIESNPFDVKSLTENAVHLISIEGFKKNLEIICDIDYSIPDLVLGDSKRVQQVLLNILKNAIKFTKEGYVHTSLSKKDENTLLFTITDTGIGVLEKNKYKIFESYYQGDPSISRKYGGTGLGLTICKGLVEMMGGEIGINKNPYGGSVFWFTFPFRSVKENQVSMYEMPVPANTKVLIVDDSPLATESLVKKLKVLGVQNIRTATNAKETYLTLQYATHLEEPFDMAFIDMHMPVFDGWNLAEDIRQNSKISKTKLFLMVPEGLMGSHATEKIKELFDGYIYKPAQINQLENLLKGTTSKNDPLQLLEELQSEENFFEGGKQNAFDSENVIEKGTKILVAEDHPVNRRILVEFLNRFGAEVYEAENGTEAVETIKTHPGIQLIFMDIQMPEMDGIDATVTLRKNNYAGIIIACTANNDKSNFTGYAKNGINDVLIKPFKRENVKAILDKWNSVLTLPVASEIAFLDSNIIINNELWDTNDFEDTIAQDWDLGRQILLDFIEQTKILIENAEKAVENKDFETVHRIAHTIKGSSGAISANKMCFTAGLISNSSKSEDIEGVKKHLDEFKDEFDTFLMISGKWKHLQEDLRKN